MSTEEQSPSPEMMRSVQPPVADSGSPAGDPLVEPDLSFEATPVSEAPPKKRSGLAKSAREWIIVVVIAIAAAVLMKVFVVQQFYVSGHSMDTTLHDYDRVLVNKLSYKLH